MTPFRVYATVPDDVDRMDAGALSQLVRSAWEDARGPVRVDAMVGARLVLRNHRANETNLHDRMRGLHAVVERLTAEAFERATGRIVSVLKRVDYAVETTDPRIGRAILIEIRPLAPNE